MLYLVEKVEKLKNNEINKILIIRLSALGDSIHTLPLANALRQKYSNIQIDWVVEDKAEKFIVNNPLLNNVYVLERKKWKTLPKIKALKAFFSIIKKIRTEKYDIVIDTQQLLKSALIMQLSKGKRKIALDGGREFSWLFANEIIKTDRKQFDINYHVVKRNLEIAQYLGCEDIEPQFIIPDFSKEYSQEIMSIVDNLNKTKKTIIIAPATTWVNKHWTVQGWIDVIKEFKASCNIILTATEKERVLTEQIVSKFTDENIIDLTGKTTIADIVYLCKNADLVISPDSGSAHIAWASACKSIITLFFSTSANRTAPYGCNYYSLSTSTVCSPCMKKHCKNKNDKNHCIYGISSGKLINIVKKVLQ